MMSVSDVAMGKVRTQVAQRRLRLDDFFADFDRLHTGRLTAPQFARVLTLNHIKLSQEEMAALAVAFQPRGKGAAAAAGQVATAAAGTVASTATVNAASGATELPPNMEVGYTAFLAALRQPLPGATADAAATTYAAVNTSPLSQEEEDLIRPSVHMLRHAIKSRGIDVVSSFRDRDPLHTGLVTAAQFERCVPMFENLKPEVVKLFARKYGDGCGNVAYMAWCREVDESLPQGAGGAGCTMVPSGSGGAAATAEPHGHCSGGFLHSFGTSTYVNPNLTAPELVRIIREQCALYRLRFDDFLTDFDKHRTGTVSAPQFESALGRLKFVKFTLSEENIATLIAAYAQDANNAETFRGVTGNLSDAAIRVNYTSFLFDINPKNFNASSEIDMGATEKDRTLGCQGEGPVNYFAATHAPDLFVRDEAEKEAAHRIMEKVSRLVRTSRIFLSPVLRDFDRVKKAIHEHRTCTSSRFARGLATQNLILPPDELRLLIKKYTVPSADGSPSDEVNYYQFVQDADPTQAQAPAITNQAQQGAGGGSRLGVLADASAGRASVTVERPATSLDLVLQHIAKQCEERELRVGEFFLDFDQLRSGTMAPSHFISALCIAGLTDLSQEALDTLVQAFASSKAPGRVDCHAFLREMGAYAPLCVPSGSLTGNAATGRYGSGNATDTAPRVVPSAAATTGLKGAPELSDSEQAKLEKLLKRLRHDVKTHNALMTPFFADFDRFGRGKITRNNFQQALARHKFVLEGEDVALLCRYYAAVLPNGTVGPATSTGTSESMIEYRRFVRDVSDEGANSYATTTTSVPTATATARGVTNGAEASGTSTSVSVEDALARVCCYLQERQPRLREFFPDGDELRHGVVTRSRFRHCLNILGLRLDEPELQALEEGFAVAAPSANTPQELLEVDYPGFTATVRELLVAGLGATAVQERRQGQTTELFRSMKQNDPSTTTMTVAGDDAASTATHAEALLTVTLAKIRRGLATRRTTTLPAFREYDRTRRGFVKVGQFFACLTAVLGVPLTPLESSVVTKAFSLGNGEMGYIRFSSEVDSTDFASVS